MEGLEYLCVCCKNTNCLKDKIIIEIKEDCKTIKCLDFEKDDSKIQTSYDIGGMK